MLVTSVILILLVSWWICVVGNYGDVGDDVDDGDDVDVGDVGDVGECRGGEVVRVPAGGWPGWPD